jgi:putative Mg2+ transporter-C (MgtC) family protein
MSVIEVIGRLLLAALCSSFIGFEREAARKSAGLRTHTLVGVGAASFSVVSIIGFEGPDESRLAAQIVTGVGFLGAGAIFREGANVKGLTTAAGLWAVASVGVAAGSGSYPLAIITTVVIAGVLYSLQAADRALERHTSVTKDRIEVTLSAAGDVGDLLKFCRKTDPGIEQMSFRRLGDGRGILTLAVHPKNLDMISEMVASQKRIERVERLSPLYWTQKKPGEH